MNLSDVPRPQPCFQPLPPHLLRAIVILDVTGSGYLRGIYVKRKHDLHFRLCEFDADFVRYMVLTAEQCLVCDGVRILDLAPGDVCKIDCIACEPDSKIRYTFDMQLAAAEWRRLGNKGVMPLQ